MQRRTPRAFLGVGQHLELIDVPDIACAARPMPTNCRGLTLERAGTALGDHVGNALNERQDFRVQVASHPATEQQALDVVRLDVIATEHA